MPCSPRTAHIRFGQATGEPPPARATTQSTAGRRGACACVTTLCYCLVDNWSAKAVLMLGNSLAHVTTTMARPGLAIGTCTCLLGARLSHAPLPQHAPLTAVCVQRRAGASPAASSASVPKATFLPLAAGPRGARATRRTAMQEIGLRELLRVHGAEQDAADGQQAGYSCRHSQHAASGFALLRSLLVRHYATPAPQRRRVVTVRACRVCRP
jgi:hypothetical protein